MKITKNKSLHDKNKTFTAVVPAAGKSTRMRGIDKLFADLAGKPVIIRTLEAISADRRIENIILTVSPDALDIISNLLKKFPIPKLIKVVRGGKRRQDSVFEGIVNAPGEYIVIHDGARPLLSKSLLRRILDSVDSTPGIIPAFAVSDTIKRIDDNGFVVNTLDRSKIVRIQTPQVFEKTVLMESYRVLVKRSISITDDSSVLEVAGFPVKTVEGSEFNIKITNTEDLELARAIWKSNLIHE
ncbi:MAG: 2-C-methyl-D-erythritol 4-phosphate cytidylyltransferase [Candidatus Eremiobacteraeota bacterium]|nr:2-C-methyl-D-erythritol 4-phosphate cytidylyltransferase [Candidatus Eremiobacteraeota bacterium]